MLSIAWACFDDLGREAVRQVKFADHDFDVDTEIVFFAENFDDSAARVLGGAGPVGDFDVDDYAFEILPVGVTAACSPITRSTDCFFLRLRNLGRRLLYHGGQRSHGGLRDFVCPAGIMISCVTFSSIGFT